MKFDIGEKYRQMLRSYNRFKGIGTNNGNSISNVDAADAADEFFVQCYHFKDWLKKAHPHFADEIERFITNSPFLSLAADFCNTKKHAGLTKRPRHGKDIETINTHMKLDLTPAGFVASSDITINTTIHSFKGLDIASNCLREWDQFLHDHGVSISPP